MKKLFFVLVFMFFSACLYAADVTNGLTELFYEGNNLYKDGKYDKAIEKYETIVNRGFASGPLYYNLGNCYFKLGSLGKTILYYERARRIIPNDPELDFNYKYVMSLLKDKTEPAQINAILRIYFRFLHLLNFSKWIAAVIYLWLLFAFVSITALFVNNARRFFRYLRLVIIIAFAACLINVIYLHVNLSSPEAVILSKDAIARYGPGEGEVEAFALHEGTKLRINDLKSDWAQIQLPDGKSGWLPSNSIEKI